ncbi:MAG: hypothetical protein WAO02_10840 [Verrucomicrobiia bacterium]
MITPVVNRTLHTSPAHKTTAGVVALRRQFGKNPERTENPPATMPVWEKLPPPVKSQKSACRVATLRSERGNLAPNYDGSAAQNLKSL